MKILVTGTGSSGSWAIRGIQLGEAIGARVVPRATYADIEACDVVVAVKRCPDEVIALAHRLDKFLVWDAVDFWQQDLTSRINYEQAPKILRNAIRQRAPHAVVFSTQRMQHDAEFAGYSLVLPHHAMPGLKPRPLAETVRSVGYHGGPFLGDWGLAFETACRRLGWHWRPDCTDVSELDIAVAVRGGVHAGYCATAWKSNVKLANIQAAGVPCVIEASAGYIETASGGESWVSDPKATFAKLAALAPLHERQTARARLLTAAPRVALPNVAAAYRHFLESIAT